MQSPLSEIFLQQFQTQPESIIRAPGRVNLIGEHTDYNDGFVLPCAIDFATQVTIRKNGTQTVRVFAADYNERDEFSTAKNSLKTLSSKQWANYIRGVVWAFAERNGYTLPEGVDIAVSGNVPQGAGLSSSAALEVAIGKALQHVFQFPIDETEIALLGQYAENHFVGCNCGIMDQLTSARGEKGKAVLIDCRSLKTQAVQIPQSLSIMIIHSHVKRGLVGSEYNTRREQCETAAAHFGVKALRDVDLAQFDVGKTGVDPIAAKRARYIIQENQRTLDAAKAMQNNDIAALSELMAQSHIGMRDEFEITHPAVDLLVELVGEVIGTRGGVRMTGGGFGGCIVTLVPHKLVDDVKAHVAQNYHAKTGLQEEVFVCQPRGGVSVL
ncbi:galactokinase [Kingella negevensis]|uniref:galactokinase n=1 Tax=Kingella negevensis TaxID=1522312 RepID=UPI00254E77B7|nr:galactokinase [Kingella negevensis]MDK4680901.1 galactokinase [Kingella negevensis]MDK4683103.1 galactokinase [Kingella negevensis]MDK4691764.1 galactokinase [Kingella negevensis]MDK4693083.1 galactokinase [Kingella negevensis]MDK4699385.1 galactokinase [Kingella negevensis]